MFYLCLRAIEEPAYRGDGYLARRSNRIAVNAGADRWKGNTAGLTGHGKLQRVAITSRQQRRFSLSAAAPHRANRMHHIPSRQIKPRRDPRLTGGTATDLTAGGKQIRSGGAVNGAINAATAGQAAIGGIDDNLDIELGDIAVDRDQSSFLPRHAASAPCSQFPGSPAPPNGQSRAHLSWRTSVAGKMARRQSTSPAQIDMTGGTASQTGSQTLCQVCGVDQRRLYVRHQGMELFECTACGLIYLDPMPSAAAIDALYADAYDGTSSGYFAKVEAKLRRSRKRIKRLSRSIRPARGATQPPHRFLDIGANGGFMVEAARENGWEAVGVELDPASVSYAQTHYPAATFVQGTVESYHAQAPEPFDFVYSSEVIEHVTDVNAFVGAAAALLRRGGYLFITTPDIGHWRRPRDLMRWDGFSPPSHCLYFRPANLKRLLERHGFDVVKRDWAFKPGIKMLARLR